MQFLAANTRFCLGAQAKVVLDQRAGVLVMQTDREGVSQHNFNNLMNNRGIMAAEPDWFYWHAFFYPDMELFNVYDLKRSCTSNFFNCVCEHFVEVVHFCVVYI